MNTNSAGALAKSFQFVHKNLDGFKIKEKVDSMGINGYINYCAGLAAGTGAAAGLGGGVTLALGIPADLANTIAQQFRVTLAVIYYRTGRYAVSFPEFMKIVGLSIGVRVGIKGVEFLALRVAQELLKRLTARTLGKAVPIVGAVVGGGLNFAFIKAVGSTLLAFEDQIFNDVAERPAIGG
ncbi:hypothetical protein O7621_25015 [Solwaraspora sp. WMMD937]|uniref:hypothetical protein n=1 Tax=Solwaraspora sp. WMMD937 TaxID=3016090 RepID=UPI00249AD25E|nr:hypothetical protein [Solwaraspora sp. WMMD937]WFE21084.1 hypothetical protein O7621_25015 [Solwaraspora sp. WMMD937]